jgi:hypothetical protein
MPNDTAAANALLSRIEVSVTETPEQLRARAAALDTEYTVAVTAPIRLAMESATLKARAVAIEKAQQVEAPVAEAEAAVTAALEAYGATAEPERKAAAKAVKARQDFERARDEHEQAKDDEDVEPSELTRLRVVAWAAAETDVHEQGKLDEAQALRATAKQSLDTARAALAQARAALEKAVAAIDEPMTADRPVSERFAELLHTWPLRVALREQDGYALDAVDLAICRALCQEVADALDVVPPRLARQIRIEAANEATKALRGTQISVPAGQALNTTVGALAGLPVQR